MSGLLHEVVIIDAVVCAEAWPLSGSNCTLNIPCVSSPDIVLLMIACTILTRQIAGCFLDCILLPAFIDRYLLQYFFVNLMAEELRGVEAAEGLDHVLVGHREWVLIGIDVQVNLQVVEVGLCLLQVEVV